MKKIKLGDKIRDKITQLEGIAISKTEFLNGCTQYQIQPEGLSKEGKVKESEFVDEQQIEIIKPEKPIKKKKETSPPGGGFRNHPPKRNF